MTNFNVLEFDEIASDNGNSTTKITMLDYTIKEPSVIQRLTSQPPVSEGSTEAKVAKLLDELTVHITSKALKRVGLYNVGKRANLNTSKSENMNINIGNKHTHDIPVIMTLSLTAACSIQYYFSQHGALPKTLEISYPLGSAIPASEWTQEKASILEKRFTEASHTVIVFVGQEQVTVQITITKAKVTQEGVPAIFALVEADDDILEKYLQKYPEDKGIKPRDFSKKKILGIDIGDGTSEYIHTRGMTPVIDNCHGEKRGVGHAKDEVSKLLRADTKGILDLNRQRLATILENPDDKYHKDAQLYMDDARYNEANKILEDIQERFKIIGGDADVFMVYGGGSIDFENELYEPLVEFSSTVQVKVLWIPEKYAVDMNVKGLSILNRKVFFKGSVTR